MSLEALGTQIIYLDMSKPLFPELYGKTIDNIRTLEVHVIKEGIPQDTTGIDLYGSFVKDGLDQNVKATQVLPTTSGVYKIKIPGFDSAGTVECAVYGVEGASPNEKVLESRNFTLKIQKSPVENALEANGQSATSVILLVDDLNTLKTELSSMDTYSTQITYAGDDITKIEVYDGATLVSVENMTYLNGALKTRVLTKGATTVTSTYNYDLDGNLISITKA